MRVAWHHGAGLEGERDTKVVVVWEMILEEIGVSIIIVIVVIIMMIIMIIGRKMKMSMSR